MTERRTVLRAEKRGLEIGGPRRDTLEDITTYTGTHAPLQIRPLSQDVLISEVDERRKEDGRHVTFEHPVVNSTPPFLQVGKPVLCLDGSGGKVARLLPNLDGGATYFVVETSIWLRKREVLVPMDWITGETREGIQLRVNRSELSRQPEHRSDSDLLADIDAAVWQNRLLRAASEGFEITLQDAVATMKGHASRVDRARLVETIREVPGVLGLQNQIVSDDELVELVFKAIKQDGHIQDEQIRVAAQQGIIYLAGSVSSADTARMVEMCAARVPQVRGVACYLRTPGHRPLEIALIQPRIGQEVFGMGKPVGRVSRVIINPQNRLVSGFAVQAQIENSSSSWLDRSPEKREVIIPARLVQWVTIGGVLLRATRDEIHKLPAFDISQFQSPPHEWQPPFPYSTSEVLLETGTKLE
jgi:osmotically-inducible protein OsmY